MNDRPLVIFASIVILLTPIFVFKEIIDSRGWKPFVIAICPFVVICVYVSVAVIVHLWRKAYANPNPAKETMAMKSIIVESI